jgi:hypothetical protein
VLVVVLVLVLAAAGLLVAALLRSAMLFAWLSVAVSLVAAVLLAVDWWQRKRAAAAAEPEDEDEPFAISPRPAEDPGAEPAEEQTDAADVLTVNESDAEVLVVDERPRYHLTGCGWLGDRPTLPLPVREARELGFTPCARCSPDRRLAARARKATRE